MSDAFKPNSALRARQRNMILEALRAGPVSTVEARERLGIAHPAGRVLELRKLGHEIATERRAVHDSVGRPHTSALYVLKCEAAA